MADINDLIMSNVKLEKKSTTVLPKNQYPELFKEMRAKCPVPGTDFKDVFCVVVRPGPGIGEHDHEEWIVLYYAEPADTAVIVANERILPQKGDFLVLPPKVRHEVEPNIGDGTRVSIAMKVVHDGHTSY